MASMYVNIGMIFLAQVAIGILGNLSLLYHYMFLYFSGHKPKPIDLILRHLTVANSLVNLSRGIPETMTAFGMKDFLSEFGCKLVFYVHRVARGVSLSTTCLLSVFQAIIISPRNSRWAGLKVKALGYIGPSNLLCWFLYMVVNIKVPMYVIGRWRNENNTNIDFGYCSFSHQGGSTDLPYAIFISTPDTLCLCLTTWASGSMVFILHRHKQRVQHIHRSNISPRSSPEIRATHSILILVSTFVSFYTLSAIIYLYFYFFDKNTQWLVKTSALINACFPTVSPFILSSSDPCVCKFFFVCTGRNVQLPHLVRKI